MRMCSSVQCDTGANFSFRNISIFLFKFTFPYTDGEPDHMPVVMDQYDDGCAEVIKCEIDDFLEKQREDEKIIFYEEKRMAEEEWCTEEAKTLELEFP